MTTIVHDTTEAVCLCLEHSLYLKPIAKLTVSVALPQLKLPGKSISNWEVMERVKAMVSPEQFSALRISKSTMDFIRFEGEVENKGVVKGLLSRLDGKTIKLSGFTDVLKVRAVENKVDFPTRHDWDSFFRDAKDMNETLPGERPDTIHLEGLPCRWFSHKDSPHPDRPSEDVLSTVFSSFGKIRNVDIPMLDPYREEMMDKNFSTFSFGGHLNFDGYVQYQEYGGFIKAMDTLRGMKLMLKGEDGKAVACNIKVSFDTSKHLSDVALKKRSQERLKLQELERQREEQKRREKEDEEQRKEEERKQKEQEEEEKERRKEERLRKREQKLREREERKNLRKVKRQQEEEQKKLQLKIAMEERRLLLAQRNLESIRLIAELLARAKALKQQEQEKEQAEREEREREELARLQELEARRQRQEAELRRVEAEKERALELRRRERELRERLLGNLLKKGVAAGTPDTATPEARALSAALALPGNQASLLGSGGGILGALASVNGLKADESGGRRRALTEEEVAKRKRKKKKGAGNEEEEKKAGQQDRREARAEDKRSGREERGGASGRGHGRHSGERGSERGHPRREQRSTSRDQGRRRRSHSQRRRSHSRRRGNDGRRGRSHSRRRSSRSSSRDRSSSGRSRSRGRGHSRGRSPRQSRHRDSRSSSRSSSRSRDRRSRSRDYRRYRRRSHSYSGGRSYSRRH